MKKVFFCILLICSLLSIEITLHAQTIDKQTYTFAVKEGDTLRMDKYVAVSTIKSTMPKPVVLFAFGGGFKGGERNSPTFDAYFQFLVQNGFVVVSTDYRTGLKNIDKSKVADLEGFSSALYHAISMAVEDYLDATDFIIRHSADWQIDPTRIIACGSSAGAVTALQAEYEICNRTALAGSLPENFNYAGVIAFAGAICAEGTPQWKNMPCPIMLFHGDGDTIVPFTKATLGNRGLWGSNFISKQLKDNGYPYYFYKVEGIGHRMASLPMRNNHQDILSFLNRLVLGKQKQCITTVEATPGQPAYKTDFTTEDYIRENIR